MKRDRPLAILCASVIGGALALVVFAQPPAPPGLSGAPVNPRQVVPHPPTNDSTATGTHTYDYTFYTVTNIELVTNVHLKKWAEFRDGSNIIRVPVSDKIVSSSKDGKNTWSVQIKQ